MQEQTESTPGSPPRRRSHHARTRRIVFGIAAWIGLVIIGISLFRSADPGAAITKRLVRHAATFEMPKVVVKFPPGACFADGASVKIETSAGPITAGRVHEVHDESGQAVATFEIFPEYYARLDTKARFRTVSAPGDVQWIVRMLFPPERLATIKVLLWENWSANKDQLWRELEPGIEALVAEAGWVLKEDLQDLLKERQAEFQTIGRVLREQAWEKHLRTAFNEDVWPLVEERARPLLTEIGDEIVAQAPVWALSWSYVRQNLPFADDAALERRVRRFIKEKALPIIERRNSDFRDLSLDISREALTNPRFLSALEESLHDVVKDPRFRDSVKSIAGSWMTSNPRMKALLAEAWKRPTIQDPFRRYFDTLEPSLREIGNSILLDDERKGINPDLAEVLRRKLVGTEEHWIVLEFGDGGKPDAGHVFEGVVGENP